MLHRNQLQDYCVHLNSEVLSIYKFPVKLYWKKEKTIKYFNYCLKNKNIKKRWTIRDYSIHLNLYLYSDSNSQSLSETWTTQTWDEQASIQAVTLSQLYKFGWSLNVYFSLTSLDNEKETRPQQFLSFVLVSLHEKSEIN